MLWGGGQGLELASFCHVLLWNLLGIPFPQYPLPMFVLTQARVFNNGQLNWRAGDILISLEESVVSEIK